MKLQHLCIRGMLFVLIFFVGCHDDNQDRPNIHKITIEEAKQWFESNIASRENSEYISGRTQQRQKDPDWNFAKIVRYRNGEVISVPLKYEGKRRLEKGAQSRLVLLKDQSGEIKLEVIRSVGTSPYLKQAGYSIGRDDFSGIVEVQDWDGNFLGGEYYSNGRPVAKLEKTENARKSSGRSSGYTYVLVVVHWYQEVFMNGVSMGTSYLGATHYYKLVYSTDTFSDIYGTFYNWTAGGGSGGGGTGCPYAPNCTDPIPFDSGEVIVDIEEVTPADNVTDNTINSCLKGVVSNLTNAHLANDINLAINRIFNSNSNTNLIINENPNLTSQHTGQPIPARTTVTSQANPFEVTITLNPNVLTSSSSEYVGASLYHEAMHAYLNALPDQSRDQLEQHVEMATSYIDWLVGALQEVFPNLSDKTAAGLALRGLGDMMRSNPSYWNTLIQQYGFLDNQELISLTDAHRNGTAGAPCQ